VETLSAEAQAMGHQMIVLAANNSNLLFGYLAGKHEGRMGVMCSPQSKWRRPVWFLPYAIDNGMYAATQAGKDWPEREFLQMLDKAKESDHDPLFVVVPDVLYDRDETLRRFDKYAPRLERMGFRLAIACQDGMTPRDVPDGVVAFIGGSDSFKAKTWDFCEAGLRVHVGRVNGFQRLVSSHKCGAFSCDGSGFFMEGDCSRGRVRGSYKSRLDPLMRYLEWAKNETENQRELFKCHH